MQGLWYVVGRACLDKTFQDSVFDLVEAETDPKRMMKAVHDEVIEHQGLLLSRWEIAAATRIFMNESFRGEVFEGSNKTRKRLDKINTLVHRNTDQKSPGFWESILRRNQPVVRGDISDKFFTLFGLCLIDHPFCEYLRQAFNDQDVATESKIFRNFGITSVKEIEWATNMLQSEDVSVEMSNLARSLWSRADTCHYGYRYDSSYDFLNAVRESTETLT